VITADMSRLAPKSDDPGFGKAREQIEQLLRDGGQARWLTAQLDAGYGMNDLARHASELFGQTAGTLQVLPGRRP
jgi:carboxylate-amine ligase